MDMIIGIAKESVRLFNEMSPYLLFGFLFSGILHAVVDPRQIAVHLGKNDISSVLKASLLGVPLPLCSCGVIPAAMMLKKEGAAKAAVLSFLVSTPTNGVDAIMVTYSLLGPFFTVYRVIASFFAGIFTGCLSLIADRDQSGDKNDPKGDNCVHCSGKMDHKHTAIDKFRSAMEYGFVELVGDVGRWLIAGVIVGGAISYFLPDNYFSGGFLSGWKGMILALLISAPMYVCASGSTPIAAALMYKGLDPGAAFVFLLAGPATNAVTMTVIMRSMGKRTLAIYLSGIAFVSMLLGAILNVVWKYYDKGNGGIAAGHEHGSVGMLGMVCSIVLTGLIVRSFFLPKKRHEGASRV
ncbi:MAG: SO_0444 family Cu/Zn efflux transporter [Candidatus Omnitrophica bacterium]|nr:SO_0444 family Cu/Zn efflux transporter [Candidatus Omnitrophota bacterium]